MITGRNKRALEGHFDCEPFLEQTLEAKGNHIKLASVRESSTLADLQHLRQGDSKGLGHAVLRAKAHAATNPPHGLSAGGGLSRPFPLGVTLATQD